jgi:thioredoxin reductase (NADPH)
MRTSAPGIFACGDCTKKSLRQVVTACGDGATAAHAAELYIDELKGQAY